MQKSSITSDQLVIFLSLLREGNTVAAARRLKLDHSTVSRRLAALERAIGTRLFDRSPRGLAPTAAAGALVPYAERVESALLLAAESVGEAEREASGTVRLATAEVFGTHVVAPAIPDLRARHPALALELAPESRSISLSKREADIAVTVRRPPRGRLVARKLVEYRLGLYAAPEYLAAHPAIAQREDLTKHLFVSYVDELVDFPEVLALNQLRLDGEVVFRSSSSTAQHAAVARGVGIGLLHAFAVAGDPRLVPVLPDAIAVTRSYFLVIHADLQRVPRVRAVADFLDETVRRRKGDFR